MIHILRTRATEQQVREMLETLRTFIKLAVDIQRGVIAGGGVLHADCEALLLNDGSRQEDVWGADWVPSTQQMTFEAMINIRPKQGNRSMEIQSQDIRTRITEIVKPILEGI